MQFAAQGRRFRCSRLRSPCWFLPQRQGEARTVPAFYQGKQGRLFTMGSPGGGYDTYTRTVERIPGEADRRAS